MPIIRTPDERFINLSDFPYSPRYVTIDGLRVHYVDEGSGETVLCLHGEPTWSYLFRKAIRVLSERCRVIAVDFIGFGRSDKFTLPGEYSMDLFHSVLSGFIDKLGLERITLVGHDGGGVAGLLTVCEQPDRFSRLVIMNTDLPTGDQPANPVFHNLRQLVQIEPDTPIGVIIRAGLAYGYKIPEDVIAAYEAPFPDPSSKAGPATWPLLTPTRPDDPGAGAVRKVREVLSKWQKPTLLVFSDEDPVYAGDHKYFSSLIPSARKHPMAIIQQAGHFLLEEKGEEVARHIMNFMAKTPTK